MPLPTWSTSRAAPSGATSVSRSPPTGGHPGRSDHTPHRASSPDPTASPDFPNIRPGAGIAANVALYGDLELRDPRDRWTVGGAVRFEHFDLFGSTTNGKLSARYGLSDTIAVRGGISSGFRAPTPGQQNTLNVQTTIDPETLQLVDSTNVPSTFRAARPLVEQLQRQGNAGKWTVATAARLEDFEDFGATLNGKLAGRYQLNQDWALRGSVSSGFRAPTPGQQNAFNVSTRYDLQLMDLVNDGIIPSTSRVAQLRGGRLLEPERSINYSLGTVIDKGPLKFTVDYFRIDLSNRLALTQSFVLSPKEVENLIAEGVTSARNLQNFRFFTNDFETRTQGIDLVITYKPAALGGDSTVDFLFNHTDTEVREFNRDVLDTERIRRLQKAVPGTRWNLTMHRGFGRWRLLGRLSYYDDWYDSRDVRVYNGEYLFDLEVSYPLSESVTFTTGVQNLLDNQPQENPNAAASGNRYSTYTPFNYNGTFYYVQLGYNWKWEKW